MTSGIVKKFQRDRHSTSIAQEDMDTARWPYATIQLSCSLRLRPRGPSAGPKRDELGPRKKDFERIENDLKHLVARSEEFELSKLYDPDRQLKEPGHTLLPSLSRHRVIDVLPDYFNEKHAKEEFPRVLVWQGRTPENPTWNAFLRVQVARDRNTSDDGATDTNDWLVTAKQHCGLGGGGDGGGSAKRNMVRCRVCDRQHYLGELRRFYAFLFTQRRQATFASNVTDRAYNVWLPPTLLIQETSGREDTPNDSAFAVLPFLSLLRLPNQSAWRPTLTLTVLFIPVRVPSGKECLEGVLEPRALTGAIEAAVITSSLQGSISHAPRYAGTRFQCIEGNDLLRRYLMETAKRECPRPGCKCFRWSDREQDSPTATIRQYVEAILLATAANAPQAIWERGRRKEHERQRLAASEVERSVRLTSIWSVQLLSRDKIIWREQNGRYEPAGFIREDGRFSAGLIGESSSIVEDARNLGFYSSQIAGLPGEMRRVLRELARPGHLPTDVNRIDDIYTLDTTGGMTWKMPRSRCLLSIQSVQDDHFPDASTHKTFAWMGVMIIAAVAIREMTQALLHETIQAKDSQDLARVDRGMLLELEEVYDVDIVGSAFAQFYRNLRIQLGLDADYRRVREQVQSFSAATSLESNIRNNTWARAIAASAAAFGAAVLLLGLFGYPRQLAHNQHSEIWWAVAVLVTAFGLAGATLLISRRREHPSRKVISAISCTALLAVVIFILAALHFAIGTPVPW